MGLVAACVLNINGVVSMMFDQGGAASIVILITAAALVASVGQNAWSWAFALFALAICLYLALGTFFYNPTQSVEEPGKYLRAYGGSVLIVWALTGYVVRIRQRHRLGHFVRFVRNTFLVSAVSIWLSPILYTFYTNLPFSSQNRMGGFFGNPNEAAMVAVLALAFTLAVPIRNRIFQVTAIVVVISAVFLTFSKAGMTSVIVMLGWYLIRTAKGGSLLLIPLGVIVAVFFVQDPEASLRFIAEHPLLDLDPNQRARILAIEEIFSGQINQETSTGRTYLWSLVAGSAWQNFPFGMGLGSAHHIVGGIYELDAWQGAHNTFLMMWGEAGPIPPLLLISSVLLILFRNLRKNADFLVLACLLVLLVDLSVTHGALAVRYHNIGLAIVLGLSIDKRRVERPFQSRPILVSASQKDI